MSGLCRGGAFAFVLFSLAFCALFSRSELRLKYSPDTGLRGSSNTATANTAASAAASAAAEAFDCESNVCVARRPGESGRYGSLVECAASCISSFQVALTTSLSSKQLQSAALPAKAPRSAAAPASPVVSPPPPPDPKPQPQPRPQPTAAARFDPASHDADAADGYMHVGNASLDAALVRWLDERHRMACTHETPVYFAPFSPNGIGNKLMSMVMAFHMAIVGGRTLVVSDWPPSTLDTNYALDQLLRPSSCQRLFDADRSRPRVKKCTVVACPTFTRSKFRRSFTQPHWAHMSPQFLDVPAPWSHLSWLAWWRAITQYLLTPGDALLDGLAATLSHSSLLRSPLVGGATPTEESRVLRRGHKPARPGSLAAVGFAERFASRVAKWGEVRRPLIGVHVRLGDGCWDSKRGGCKYVRSFSAVVTRLREAGLSRGTIFLATDNATIAKEAVASPTAGFDILALAEDRNAVEKSHAKGDRRKEKDELLHLQLLDLALLSQADVIAGVFGSTFVKSALQLGNAPAYVSLDTFPWCPLLRCYWGWRDMCHNCDLCANHGGGGEACNNNGYHTAAGLRGALSGSRPERGAFRRFMGDVERESRCPPFASHPLGPTMYDRPVVGSAFAPKLPAPPTEACASKPATAAGGACECGFRRFGGVDNAAAAARKPTYHYGHALVRSTASAPLASLADCEARCCAEPLCHSVVWRANTSTCVVALAIAHGARADDWCWRPTHSANAVTSIRLPGIWQQKALREAATVLSSGSLVRRGSARGPRSFSKPWRSPAGHCHPCERSMGATSCEANARGALEVSDLTAAAIPITGVPSPQSAAACGGQLEPMEKQKDAKKGERPKREVFASRMSV